jgi:outer membrane protein
MPNVFIRLISIPLSVLIMVSPSHGETLQGALVKAYQGNPTLKSERARLRAVDEGVPQALSGWRPTVTVSGSYGVKRSDSTVNGPARKTADVTEPLTASLTVSQSIYRGGRIDAATVSAESIVKATRARLSAVEQSVLLSAVTAYADVVRDQALLGLNKNNERVLHRQLEATQDRFRVGEVTRTDVSLAESRLSSARAARISAQGVLVDSHARYANIVGEPPGVLKTAKPLEKLPISLVEAIKVAKRENYAVIEARHNEVTAKSNVREITGELLPTLSVDGSMATNHETANDRSENQVLSLVARISVPLYASGSVASRVRAAKKTVSQRREEYNQAIRDAIEGATEAWQVLKTGRAQIQAFSAAVKAAEIALEGVREEANVGSRTILDVLNTEQELLDARVGLVGSMRDELVATYDLRRAMGDGTASKLGLPVAPYDVEKHYREVRGKWWGLTSSDDN